MRLTIRVDGELVRKGLEDLNAEIPQIGRQQIRAIANRIVRRMQIYPPEPAHRTRVEDHPTLGTIYTRTGRTGLLFRSWKIYEVQSKGYTIENSASRRGKEYSKYVVGNAYGLMQAWMHKRRWQLFRDVVEEELQRLPSAIEDRIVLVARRKNLEAKAK